MLNAASELIPEQLDCFISSIEINYHQKICSLDLFNPTKTALWTDTQKKYFAAVFYHIRGYFINFMWYIANFSSDVTIKQIITENIHEEIGKTTKLSHEKLYERFATECGVNIHEEIVEKTHYLPFVREFNKQHLQWLSQHDEEERFAAFSAYERLDNIDYPYLTRFAESLNLSSSALTFFRVHSLVDHFDSTLEKLLPIWQKSSHKITLAMDFIFTHQYLMWKNLSDVMFSL